MSIRQDTWLFFFGITHKWVIITGKILGITGKRNREGNTRHFHLMWTTPRAAHLGKIQFSANRSILRRFSREYRGSLALIESNRSAVLSSKTAKYWSICRKWYLPKIPIFLLVIITGKIFGGTGKCNREAKKKKKTWVHTVYKMCRAHKVYTVCGVQKVSRVYMAYRIYRGSRMHRVCRF